jgi:hypothetical protein
MENKLYRTLIRIEFATKDYIFAVIPGWDPHTTVSIKRDKIPEEISILMKKGKRLHAHVNLDAEEFSELIFEQWEPK